MNMEDLKERIAKSIRESLEDLGEEAAKSDWFASNKFAEENS